MPVFRLLFYKNGFPQAVRPVDSECHCLTDCIIGQAERCVLFNNVASRNIGFVELCNVDKFKSLVCPINATDCKLVNRYLESNFKERDRINLSV